jgi:aspartyl-tRNA(Asn)/glutamyl-tRNA(Gln) amidotransferase subunit A
MENDFKLTITHLAPLIKKKNISPVELTRFFLKRISKLQPGINAYITITPETALAEARRAEMEILQGRYRGALHGMPVSLKDLFYTRGIRTTAGSKVLRRFVPKEDATVVNLLRDAGCVFLGKTNMHEFAYGATNVNPHYGPVRNPWDTSRISGGSSGGSAAAVITGQSIASFGSDTGGSIRIPSAACGCVGFKPTYGLISLDGVIPLSYSLDHAGPLCRCVADAALLFEALSRPAPDHGFHSGKRSLMRAGKRVNVLRIGVPRQYFFDRIQPEVKRRVMDAIRVFEQLGAEIQEVSLKGMEKTTRLAADITAAEALAYHQRRLERKANDYGEDIRSRLRGAEGMTAAAYIQTQQERYAYAENLARVLESVNLLAAPTIPMVAPAIDQSKIMIGRRRVEIRPALLSLTRPANLSGLPAISVPCGFSSEGLPVGLQLIGRRYDEYTLLAAAHAYERATPWHRLFPPH